MHRGTHEREVGGAGGVEAESASPRPLPEAEPELRRSTTSIMPRCSAVDCAISRMNSEPSSETNRHVGVWHVTVAFRRSRVRSAVSPKHEPSRISATRRPPASTRTVPSSMM